MNGAILLDTDAAAPDTADWTYVRGGAERGLWRGAGVPALAPHFHDECQVSFVLGGTRRFMTAAGPVAARAGEFIVIPAGLPHVAADAARGRAVLVNAYLPMRASRAVVLPMRVAWLRERRVALSALREMLDDAGAAAGPGAALSRSVLESDGSIAEIAAAEGMSREAFSRRFARLVGMAPGAYRLVGRLNRARRLLRRGEAIAMAAADAGFADQSHLGRHFRRAFGTSPGAYRRG